MELIYTARTSGFRDGKKYRNPRFFAGPEKGVTAVVIEGEWPHVKAAYEERKVEVKVISTASASARGNDPAREGSAGDHDREALAKAYEAKFGKPPAGNMKTENILKKLEEA